ncbi:MULTISPECIES: group 1 truncated hemoglobin [Haloferax]|uniref:Group 1 truncated hemoglobin n=2 Tax=Haloferax TaxID=2251 RepID=A0A6G1YYX1_9EURY|nr:MULTISPECIES: group 1 truncated hemoglobin [Haloferax]KAB1186626.1 group 1 truncated hemoglobin [Haloferax sp. CBA1149]MRW79244.1 group 1 truncated hemoglobin [Haloferax marinisediminis]
MSGNKTLYERLGGKEAISAVVDEFYDRMLADDELAPYFEDTDMQKQRAHQVQFISAVAGGPVDYTGADMREAHEHLELSHDDFAATATHLKDALEEFDVEENEIDEVLDAVASLEDEIVTA